jgi:hypothetical protein
VNLQHLTDHSEDDSLGTIPNWVFLAITHTVGPPISVQAILESNPLPAIIQKIAPPVLPWLSGDHRLDTLTITRTYEEQLLMGFPFSSKGIHGLNYF